jgi:hypothetical protein
MFKLLLDWFLHSQAAKTASAAAGGSIISITALMGILEKQVTKEIEAKHKEAIAYVDRKYDNVDANIKLVQSELMFIRTGQAEMNTSLRIMSDRIFEMNKGKK